MSLTCAACLLAAEPLQVRTARAQSAPAAGSAPGKEQARRLFEEGVELEKKSDYAGALAKYKAAEQLAQTLGLRFHKAYCLEMTGKLASALEEYEAAEKMAREANKQDIKAAVATRLEPLRARVPQIAIRLTTPVKDAEVQLDGATVAAPLLDGKAFRLDPGEHGLTARAAGHSPFTRRLQIPEGLTTTVDIALDPLPMAPAHVAGSASGASPVTEPPAEPSRGRSILVPVLTTAGAVVLAGTGVAMFLVAGGAQSDAQDACPTKLSCDSEQSRVRTFDALALGSFIGAAGLGVLSVILWTSRGAERAPRAAQARLVASLAMMGLEGAFW